MRLKFHALCFSCSAKWCCGDIDTKVEAKLIPVKKSRTIQVYQTEYYKLKSGTTQP